MTSRPRMPGPLYEPGQAVEVRTSQGWRPAIVLEVETELGRHRYRADLSFSTGTFAEGNVRRPRIASPFARAPKPPPRRPKAARPRTAREPVRLPGYKAWIRAKQCLWCALAGKPPTDREVDPHHHGPKAMGVTADDTWIVPACRTHHDAVQERRLKDLPGQWSSWLELECWILRRQVELLTMYVRRHGELA